MRNSVRNGLNLIVLVFFASGCFSSTAPCFCRQDIAPAIKRILKKEYKVDATVKLMGSTLWVYLPLEDLLEVPQKPEKYIKLFDVGKNNVSYQQGDLRLSYKIATVPPQEKRQQYALTKEALRNIGGAWQTVRRVMFSTERPTRDSIKFYCLVASDIKNGFEIRQIVYYQDLIKVSYRFISITEYQHRVISDSSVSETAIADRTGSHVVYADLTMKDFLAQQIRHRINLKYGDLTPKDFRAQQSRERGNRKSPEPGVEQRTVIDKEIARIIEETLAIYPTRDFTAAELENLISNTVRSMQLSGSQAVSK